METIRLNKYLSQKGYCSRRRADELIAEGKVIINDIVVTEMGTKVDPEKDVVSVEGLTSNSAREAREDGTPLTTKERREAFLSKVPTGPVYIALNKPVDFITSTTSEQGQSVMDLLITEGQISKFKRKITERVYPVGRLDKDSEGLVLLTSDGELANKLTHPRYEHEKEYEVTITSPLRGDAKKVLEGGMYLDEEWVKGIRIVREWNSGRRTLITVVLTEGKNRQIRKMFGTLGYDVVSLKRTRMGKLKLGTLPPGRWKYIKKNNIV